MKMKICCNFMWPAPKPAFISVLPARLQWCLGPDSVCCNEELHVLSQNLFLFKLSIFTADGKCLSETDLTRLGTNELSLELPGQQAPLSLIDEPQSQPNHQEVACEIYVPGNNSRSFTNLSTAGKHPKHLNSSAPAVFGGNGNFSE